MNTITAKVRSITGPEHLSNGGKKFYVALDNGAGIVTFSDNCQKELMKSLDQDIEFLIDGPLDPQNAPRILKATQGTNVLYDREAAAARANAPSGQWGGTVPAPSGSAPASANFYQDETTRAVEFAVDYLGKWNAAVIASGGSFMAMDLFIAKLVDISTVIHEQILELRKPHPTMAEVKQEALAPVPVPDGWQGA